MIEQSKKYTNDVCPHCEQAAAIAKLRDQIAISVLQAEITSGRDIPNLDRFLKWSYEVAGAMLKVRGEVK